MRTFRGKASRASAILAVAVALLAAAPSAASSTEPDSAGAKTAAEQTEIVPRDTSPKNSKPKPQDSAVSTMAAGCYGNSCTGQNPSTMGCSVDSRTLEEFTQDGLFRIELRQSNTCWAAWTRITSLQAATGAACNVAFGQIRGYDWSTDTRKGVHGVQAACPGNQARNTAMWTYSDAVRACYSYKMWNGDPDTCTRRR